MIQFDLLTLAFATGLASIVSSSVMLVLWRINPDIAGVPQWTLSVLLSTGAFFASALRDVIPGPDFLSMLLSNTLSTCSVLVALEGCLRFRGFSRPHPLSYLLVAATLILLINWLFRDDMRARLLIIDAISFSGFVTIVVVMLRQIEDRAERMVYALPALFAAFPAVGIAVRWVDALDAYGVQTIADLETGNLIFLTGMIYIMGWTFSLTVACYYKAEKLIAHLAREDALTGLPNRRSIDEMLDRFLREAGRYKLPFGVVMVDMDDFKLFNDRFGHSFGDEVLKCVAQRLQVFQRDADFVGRLGGDEFVLIVNDVPTPEAARSLLRRLLHDVSGPVEINGRSIEIRPSLGIAIWPEDGSTADELLQMADKRMYAFKASKGGSSPAF